METPDAGRNIISRGLPKTGQVIQYRAGDDGQFEAGWWRGRLNANNRTRWIARTIAGDDIVIDRATGLMWAGDGTAAGCAAGYALTWNVAIDSPLGLLWFAGFNDWRLPNIKELLSILRYVGAAPFIAQPPFSNTQLAYYWSSTTDPRNVTRAMVVNFNIPITNYRDKTLSYCLRSVRKGL